MSVEVFFGDQDAVLLNDGDAQLKLVPSEKVHLGRDYFGFCIVDGGGFTGLVVHVEDWERMKAKVDAYVTTLKKPEKEGA